MIKGVTLLILLAIAFVQGPQQQQEAPSESWKRYSPQGCGLSLELPSQALPLSVPMPEDIKNDVRYMKYYQYSRDRLVLIIVHCSSLRPFPPKELAEGVVKGIIDNPDVTEVQYSTEPSAAFIAPLKGTYKQKGTLLEINGFAVARDTHTWFVIAIHRQIDEAARLNAHRILESVKLDGPTCADQGENQPL